MKNPPRLITPYEFTVPSNSHYEKSATPTNTSKKSRRPNGRAAPPADAEITRKRTLTTLVFNLLSIPTVTF